jgi:uncharacterized membrane protein (DUF373 family)
MRSFRDIKRHYDFTGEDERRLRSLRSVVEDYTDCAMDSLQSWMLETKETAPFFVDENKKKRVFAAHRSWFVDLFSGTYDVHYYERLIRIGQVHVRAQIEAHLMNRAINILRTYCLGIVTANIENAAERTAMLISLEKMLDINLDVITSSYIEEGLKTYSGAYRVKNALVTFAQGFSQTMNLVLILSLMGLTIGVVVLFVSDIGKFLTGHPEYGIVTALGSLIFLWVMIELMNTEIAHLKGGKFYISVFIGVALVAFIRESLIMTLSHESMEKHYVFIALILVLGIVFWLVTRAENMPKG